MDLLLINIKLIRKTIIEDRVSEIGLPFVYINQVGGQDELVFDVLIMNGDKEIIYEAPPWQEHNAVIEFNEKKKNLIIYPLMNSNFLI